MSRNTDPGMAGGVTSIYLDNDSKAKLDALAASSGLSRSLVVRNLLQRNAGPPSKVKMRKLVAQLAEMIEQT